MIKKKFLTFAWLLCSTATSAWAANEVKTVSQLTGEVTLTDDVDYTINSTTPFADGASVNIVNTEHAVLIFSYIKPSLVLSQNLLKNVLINGEAAVNDVNCQVRMYGPGAIVLPYDADFKPLTVYAEPNFEGESYDDYDLGNSGGYMQTLTAKNMNNKIRSFKLKRGYMVTFAVGTGGWGYSRCFVADKEDLEVSSLPTHMDARISSYRLFKWWNAQKKGLASNGDKTANAALNTSWCYDWGQGNASNLPDQEWVPNHIYEDWPSSATCGSVTGSCNMKTNNEPGNSSDDHPQTVDVVLDNWQNLMRTGMRLCSESSHDGSWSHLRSFIDSIDARGWRCDMLDLHCYWPSGSFWSLENYYNNYGKRPIWISEWVWGASWNKNGIFTTDGTFSTSNQQYCYDNTKPILDYIETLDCVERYAYWNSEADASKIYKDGTLSIFGKYYSELKSAQGYKASKQKIPNVVYVKPTGLTATYNRSKNTVALTWIDDNGDMIDSLMVERKASSGKWEQIATVTPRDKSAKAGITYTYTDEPNESGAIYYRVSAFPAGVKTSKYVSDEASISISASNGSGDIQFGTLEITTGGTNDKMTTDFTSLGKDENGANIVPAIIMGPSTYNTTTNYFPADHVSSIQNNKFTYYYHPIDATSTMSKADASDFLIIKKDNYTVSDGKKVEVATILDEEGSNVKVKLDTIHVTFNEPFPEGSIPVVIPTGFSTVTTGPFIPKVFDVTNTGFSIKMMRSESTKNSPTNQYMNYIALEQGTYRISSDLVVTVGLCSKEEGADPTSSTCVGSTAGFFVPFTDADGNAIEADMVFAATQSERSGIMSILRYKEGTKSSVKGARFYRQLDPNTSAGSSTKATKYYDDLGYVLIVKDTDDTFTGIENIATGTFIPAAVDGIYNLNGQRVTDTRAKGIYLIKKGTSVQKILVK
jgi:hypothetical protein